METYKEALAHVRKKHKLFVRDQETIKRVKTGCVGIDWCLGGGIPRGRILEVYGQEASGKTTLAAMLGSAFQAQDEVCMFLDFEHAVDIEYLAATGLDVKSKLWLYDQPDSLEQGMMGVEKLIPTKGVGCVIIDSVAAMLPLAELKGELTDKNMALRARENGKAIVRLIPLASKSGTTVIFINQFRSNMGNDAKFNPNVTTGGKALKFFSSVRMELRKSAGTHKLYTRKQKTSKAVKAITEFSINEHGIDQFEHIKFCLKAAGLIENRSGTWFNYKNQKLVRGPSETRVMEEYIEEGKLDDLIEHLWKVTYGFRTSYID